MTKFEELSAKVRDHLIKQHAQSISLESAGCRYRGSNGTMCAVGCLIPDDVYADSLEGLIATNERIITALVASGIEGTDENTVNMLRAWQTYHDHNNRAFDCSYSAWLEYGGKDNHPETFHQKLMKHYKVLAS